METTPQFNPGYAAKIKEDIEAFKLYKQQPQDTKLSDAGAETVRDIWADVEELILHSQMLGFSPKSKEELLTELTSNYNISRK